MNEQKGSVDVVGAVCPALNEAGIPCCSEPVPWARVIDSGLFQAMEDQALEVFQSEMLNKRILESPFLHACPGQCNRVVVVTKPLTNACNTLFCEICKVKKDHSCFI